MSETREKGRREYSSTHLHSRGGTWYMRLDANSQGVEIPERMAHAIKLALWTEKRTQNLMNKKTDEVHENMNCHRTALYASGLISHPNPSREGGVDGRHHFIVPLISPDAFVRTVSEKGLLDSWKKTLGTGLGIAQVKDRFDSILHTFVVGFDEHGRAVCFEKKAYGYHPFRVTGFEKIWSHYRGPDGRSSWGLASLQESGIAEIQSKIASSDSVPDQLQTRRKKRPSIPKALLNATLKAVLRRLRGQQEARSLRAR